MNANKIIDVLEKVKYIVTNYEMDFTWSPYSSSDELIEILNNIILKLRNRDYSCRDQISLLFAPTGALQEIAIDSGWSETYMKLSSVIDENL